MNILFNFFLTIRQRRSTKAVELSQRKAKQHTRRDDERHVSSGSEGSERPESEERMDSGIDERHIRRKRVTNMEFYEETQTMGTQQSRFSLSSCATGDRQTGSKSVHHIYSRRPPLFGPSRVLRTRDEDPEMDQGTDTDSCSTFTEVGQGRRQWSVRGTNLDSAAGR